MLWDKDQAKEGSQFLFKDKHSVMANYLKHYTLQTSEYIPGHFSI